MQASHADEGHVFFAPDGIEILPFTLPGIAYLSFVEGRIPPRSESYPVHLHGALEQITYVLAAQVTVETWDEATGQAGRFDAGPGAAFLTLPTQTLSYTNTGPETARVLFVCAPAYAPNNADTRLMDDHHAPTAAEREWSLARHKAAVAAFAGIVGTRVRLLTDGIGDA